MAGLSIPSIDLKGFYPITRSLTWPNSVSPLDLQGFETQARRLRYQALGDECRKQDIRHLLLAHHEDDQAETVLMRLASGHKGFGLRGMRSFADIPECWGVHGVYESGQMDLAALRLRKEEEKDATSSLAQNLRRILVRDDVCERGGIQIFRPLLGFSKGRLIQTCRARALAWEEDKTNQDAWRTPRNNIRKLLRTSKLPQALQKNSILQLANQISAYADKTLATVDKLLSFCEILLLDARCGGLIVRLPTKLLSIQDPEREGEWQVNIRKHRSTAMLLLQRIVKVVTPYEEVSLRGLEQAAVSIFPDLVEADRRIQLTSFTGGGARFQRLHSPLPAPRSEVDPSIAGKLQGLDPVFVWRLTRQPFSKAPLSFTVPPSADKEPAIVDNTLFWSPWQLWDGRYWIRLLNRSSRPLIVRSFQDSDLEHLRYTLTPRHYKDFHKLLSLAAPDKVRWTLLAIVELKDDALHSGRVLALPTLGQAGTFDSEDQNGSKKVEWQVRYKHFELGYRRLDDGCGKISSNRSLITSWKD